MPGMAERKQTRITAKVRFKEMPCRECGKPMRVGSNTRNAPRHVECGIKLVIENAQQMQAKSGPHYDRWRNAMMRALDNDTRGSGPPEQIE